MSSKDVFLYLLRFFKAFLKELQQSAVGVKAFVCLNVALKVLLLVLRHYRLNELRDVNDNNNNKNENSN